LGFVRSHDGGAVPAAERTAMSCNLEVVAADALGPAARAEIIELCESAYKEDFTRLFELLPDSVHVMARDEHGALVSHAEWVPRWLCPAGLPVLRTAYVEAVATAPDQRGRGFATAVLRRVADEVLGHSMWEIGALSPSDPAFYARLGWELWKGPLAIRNGGRFEPTSESERVMILRLPHTPATLDVNAGLTAEWREGELW
jgi:aminoglycoside 2'-N-acetyltransferase I